MLSSGSPDQAFCVPLSKHLRPSLFCGKEPFSTPSSTDTPDNLFEDAASLLLPLTLIIEKSHGGRGESRTSSPSPGGSGQKHPDGEEQDSLVQLALLSLAVVLQSHERIEPFIERQVRMPR